MSSNKDSFTEDDIQRIENVFKKIDPRSVWYNMTREHFTLHRFESGLVNDVSRCKLNAEAMKKCKLKTDYPEIVMKFFTKNDRFPYCPVQRAIIHTLASINDLTPHLIYMDAEVMVQRCITNGRMPNGSDDFDKSFFEQTAKKIAQFHCLPAPVSTNFVKWKRFLELCKTDFPGSRKIIDGSFLEILSSHPLMTSEDLKILKKFNFTNLYRFFFSEGLEKINSPIVFVHIDIHRDNRIVEEITDPETGVTKKKLHFIDLDFAMFHFRGMDLGVYFDSFGQKEYRFGDGPLPDDNKMLEFIEIYRKECSRILGDSYLEQEENQPERILHEAKVFTLYGYFLSIWIALNSFLDPITSEDKSKEFVEGLINRVKQFDAYKALLESQNLLPDIGIELYNR